MSCWAVGQSAKVLSDLHNTTQVPPHTCAYSQGKLDALLHVIFFHTEKLTCNPLGPHCRRQPVRSLAPTQKTFASFSSGTFQISLRATRALPGISQISMYVYHYCKYEKQGKLFPSPTTSFPPTSYVGTRIDSPNLPMLAIGFPNVQHA
jgi:hypothetical protein